ncbi:MAG: response regulator transcription factor [Prevotella sp.]|jgi:CheY-like chemotaxis protein|nr:response regulator transcription factor [Prevotella sp.]
MKILLVEDELTLAQSITEYLSEQDYICEHAATYLDADERINLYDYDCILLDLMLPDGNGLKLLESLKKKNDRAGVIIISEKDSLDDKIKGIRIRAVHYLPKPFHLSELSARIYALIRRTRYESNNTVQSNDLRIDLLSKEVVMNEKEVVLTKKDKVFFPSHITEFKCSFLPTAKSDQDQNSQPHRNRNENKKHQTKQSCYQQLHQHRKDCSCWLTFFRHLNFENLHPCFAKKDRMPQSSGCIYNDYGNGIPKPIDL